MDFDEYDYLEKAVENTEPDNANGGDESSKSHKKDHSRSSRRRTDDVGAKRSKTEDESSARDRHRDRGSSRHRSRSRDRGRDDTDVDRRRSSREGDKEREREERNGKDRHGDRHKDKDRDHDRDRGRKELHHDRQKDGERDRRSRSHSVRHREDGERSRDREPKEHRERDRDKENRTRKEKKENGTEPVVDPERDQRTVFAYQIPLRADERDVFEFFSKAGKVRDVRLIMDRNSRRSKGVGYIEFYDSMSVPMAIALSGQLLLGHAVMVKPSEAEKNMVQSTSTAAGQASTYSGGGRRLYVGNLHYNMTEEQLRQVFEPFGTLELIQLPLDDTGHCKGFGFIQFTRLDEAQAAIHLNGQLDIAGRTIKVSAVTDNGGTQDVGKGTGDLDDDEDGGMRLDAGSRALLMAKLDRTGAATSLGDSLGNSLVGNGVLPPAPVIGAQQPFFPSVPALGGGLAAPALPLPPIETIGVPSEYLLLKNMFDPTIETEPEFDLDIRDDVQEECKKFGSLKHIYVDKHSAGLVYLRFEDTQSAMNAQKALHGRWFAGKMITATYMLPQQYEVKFPDVR